MRQTKRVASRRGEARLVRFHARCSPSCGAPCLFCVFVALPSSPPHPACFAFCAKGAHHQGDGIPAAHAQPGRHGALLQARVSHQHGGRGEFFLRLLSRFLFFWFARRMTRRTCAVEVAKSEARAQVSPEERAKRMPFFQHCFLRSRAEWRVPCTLERWHAESGAVEIRHARFVFFSAAPSCRRNNRNTAPRLGFKDLGGVRGCEGLHVACALPLARPPWTTK